MKLGVHVSISGNLGKAAERGRAVGCEAMQVFTSNPKGWTFNIRPEEEIKNFCTKIKEYNIGPVFGHSIYLTNLASTNSFIYTNSINNLISGMVLAKNACFSGVITHIGSHGGDGIKKGLERVTNAISQVLSVTEEGIPLILETDAGSGSHLGASFSEIGELIKNVRSKKLLVCLDTAHVFAAGYDIRTKKDIQETLEKFDQSIGIERLIVLHLNDSKAPLGSRVDRHEEIGKGEIGQKAFQNIINHPKLTNLAGILETPENKDTERTEKLGLDILKELRA